MKYKDFLDESTPSGLGKAGLKLKANKGPNSGMERYDILINMIKKGKEVTLIDGTKVIFDKNVIDNIRKENYIPYKNGIINKGQIAKTPDFGGEFGIKANQFGKVTFSGGKNTMLAESLQIVGFFMNLSIGQEVGPKFIKELISNLKNSKYNLAGGTDFIKKYLETEELQEKYINSIFPIVLASSLAGKDMKSKGFNYDYALHDNIDDFYSICKEKGFTKESIPKPSTTDCLLYTGKNLLANLKNPNSTIDATSYNIKLIIKDKVVNTFIQVSLKAGGRLGDVSKFTAISNKYKYTNENFIANLYKKAKKFIFSVPTRIKKILQKFNPKKVSKDLNKNYTNNAMDIFNETINEKANFSKLPDTEILWEKYEIKENYEKLVNSIYKEVEKSKNLLDNLGEGIYYNFPKYKMKNKAVKETIRFNFFNLVSLRTFNDYISNLDGLKDLKNVEIDIIYGNTLLPLLKVYADPTNYVEYLPMKPESNNGNAEVPSLGFKYNVTSKDYMSFYIHILSVTHIDKPTYLNIQMRNKGESQYVVDGQGTITLEQFKAYYKL